MIKALILILLTVLPFSQAQETTTCASHPFLQKIENFVGTLETQLESSEFASINEQLSIYKQQDGTSIWNSEIDADENQCPDFDGQQSCCTDGFINIIELVLKANIKKGKNEDIPVPKQFLTEFTENLGKCAGKEVVQEFLAIQEISDFLADLQECQLQQYITTTNFMRRNTCSLCFSAQEIEDNFDENGKLIVQEDSLNEYIESVEEDFQCFIDINDSLYNSVIYQYSQLLSDSEDLDTKQCKYFIEWMDLIIDNDGQDIVPQIPTNCEQKSSAFGKGCQEDIVGEDNQFQPGNSLGPRDDNGQDGMQESRTQPSDGGFSQNQEEIKQILQEKEKPPRDGEMPPKDGEMPPRDGEMPPRDGEMPPRDGEMPPRDGEMPPKDGEMPPKDGELPPKDGELPPKDGQQPSQDGQQQQPPQQGGSRRMLQEESSSDYISSQQGFTIYQDQANLNKEELFQVFKEEITDPALEINVNVDSIEKVEDENNEQYELVTQNNSKIIQLSAIVVLLSLFLYI